MSKLILEIPKEEQWLFGPQNRVMVNELKKALQQKADKEINLTFFEED